MQLTLVHMIFIILTTILVLGIGVYAGTRVESAADFSTGGGKAGTSLVAGTIMGTFVGGSCTVGTAQLAFNVGASAWWFTLGGGIGCLLLGLYLAKPLRESGKETISQFLVTTYGPKSGPIITIFSSIGMFLSFVAQILAAIALLSSMFQLNSISGALITIILVICYVFFGGLKGAGMTGIAKLILLYGSLIVLGVLVYLKAGGISSLISGLPAFPYLSIFGRGFTVDLAAGLSVIVGVISTQIYFQAMFAAKDAATAKRGALVSACLIPLAGVAGILVGMYMKINFPTMNSAEALPNFVIYYLPPSMGGIVLGTLLVTVIGTGAGLTLAISTILTKDIYKRFISPQASEQKLMYMSKGLIVAVACLSLLFVTENTKSMILQWSFLSMGLRGATICFPLLGAIFFSTLVSPKAGLIALVAGPGADLVWKLCVPNGMDPLYVGLLASFVCLLIGSMIFPASKTPSMYKDINK
ncbi:MAG: sodium:solute symporter family protein [Desulfosporosinus sp.]|jgi:SSS family solute:Na+ symporter